MGGMKEYLVPCGRGEAEYDEKRSRFIGCVAPAETEEAARAFIAEIKKQHFDARHNCWCYIIKDGAERYSDDGEPQGTAGIPMLEVFRREGISNVVCVVTRYFGGVLLGAGGLLRAYTKAATDALNAAGRSKVIPMKEYILKCSYSAAERIKQYAVSAGGSLTDTEYGEEVTLKVRVEDSISESFAAQIFDASAGTVTPELACECRGTVPVERGKG